MRTRKTRAVFVCFILIAAAITTTESAGKKKINFLTGVGLTTHFFDDPILDLGVEFELVKNFYARFVLSNSFGGDRTIPGGPYTYEDPDSGHTLSPDYGIYGNALVAASAGAVYKYKALRRLVIFGQAGASYLTYKEFSYELELDELIQSSDRRIGALGGAGIEFLLFRGVDFVFGGYYQWIFNKKVMDPEDGTARNGWLKFYMGFNFRLR